MTESNQTEPTSVPVRQSHRIHVRCQTDRYGVWDNPLETADGPELVTVDDALSSPNKQRWKDTMDKEMQSIHENDVWSLVPLPSNRKAIGCKWVFKKKIGSDGSIECYKARRWAALNIVHVCFIITVLLFIRDLKLQCSVYVLSMIVALLN